MIRKVIVRPAADRDLDEQADYIASDSGIDDSMEPRHLFVYGTLRRGSSNQFAHLLSERADFIGNARMPGRLYDLGRFPGAVASNQPGEFVAGEIFRLKDPVRTLAALDEYEGADFQRVVQEVELTGQRQKVWVYFYCGHEKGRLIASGDWLQR